LSKIKRCPQSLILISKSNGWEIHKSNKFLLIIINFDNRNIWTSPGLDCKAINGKSLVPVSVYFESNKDTSHYWISTGLHITFNVYVGDDHASYIALCLLIVRSLIRSTFSSHLRLSRLYLLIPHWLDLGENWIWCYYYPAQLISSTARGGSTLFFLFLFLFNSFSNYLCLNTKIARQFLFHLSKQTASTGMNLVGNSLGKPSLYDFSCFRLKG
jgi:hypothetical protein